MNEAQKRILAEIRAENTAQRSEPAPVDASLDFEQIKENAWPSAKQYAGDIWSAVSNPVDTAQGLWSLTKGVGDKLGIDFDGVDDTYAADVVWHAMKERYGSKDAIINTINTDPAGFIADVSGLLSGGGLLTAKAAPQVSRVLKAASNMEPLAAATKTAGKVLEKTVPAETARKLYKSAVKFNNSIDADVATDAALNSGILPSRSGQAKLQGTLGALSGRVDDIVDTAGGDGVRMNPMDTLNDLDSYRNDLPPLLPDSPEIKAAVDAKMDSLLSYMSDNDITELTPKDLLAFRRRSDDLINYSRNRGNVAPKVEEDINRVLANSARNQLAEKFPEVDSINKEMGPLIELQKGLDAKVPVIERRNIFSLPSLIGAGSGGVIGSAVSSPTLGAVLGFTVGVTDLPTIKARLAMGVHRLKSGDSALLKALSSSDRNLLLALAGRNNEEQENE